MSIGDLAAILVISDRHSAGAHVADQIQALAFMDYCYSSPALIIGLRCSERDQQNIFRLHSSSHSYIICITCITMRLSSSVTFVAGLLLLQIVSASLPVYQHLFNATIKLGTQESIGGPYGRRISTAVLG